MQHPITIEHTLSQRDGERVVMAKDSEQRSFVGVSRNDSAADEFVFVQIDRVTLLEIERGSFDPRAVASERCAGIVVQARPTAEGTRAACA